jgi:hypothetical protein
MKRKQKKERSPKAPKASFKRGCRAKAKAKVAAKAKAKVAAKATAKDGKRKAEGAGEDHTHTHTHTHTHMHIKRSACQWGAELSGGHWGDDVSKYAGLLYPSPIIHPVLLLIAGQRIYRNVRAVSGRTLKALLVQSVFKAFRFGL